VTVSNELRDQLARTLRADEARMNSAGEGDPKSG